MEKRYTIKTQWFGPGEKQSKEIKILNRIVSWDNLQGITFEVDPRHAEVIFKQLKLEDAKGVSTPGAKEEGTATADCGMPF